MSVAISCRSLSKNYGEIKALQNLNLEVQENIIVGLLGVNGAGKTTTIKLLNSLIKPSSGEAYIFGVNVFKNPMKVKNLVGYLSQEPSFYRWMKGRELLECAGEIYGLEGMNLRNKVKELLELVGLLDYAERRIGTYSTGMKQRLGIAQSLINSPRLLFLDEPASSLDPLGRNEVLKLIKELKGKSTVMVSSHVLNDIERICDEVIIIDKGKLILHERLSVLKEKYISPAVLIECKENLDDLKDLLQKSNFVRSVEGLNQNGKNGRSLKIIFKDFNQGEKILPQLIVQKGLTLRRYEILAPTLEDIFVTLVNREKE